MIVQEPLWQCALHNLLSTVVIIAAAEKEIYTPRVAEFVPSPFSHRGDKRARMTVSSFPALLHVSHLSRTPRSKSHETRMVPEMKIIRFPFA